MLEQITHVLLDGARLGSEMEQAIGMGKGQMSLYAGQQTGALAALAPRLFPCSLKSPFGLWCLKNGWGCSWGIYLKSPLQIQELQAHFRNFLKVQTDSGKSLFFRFYDPRVLRIFLPTCSNAQLQEFFGSAIEYFILEDEDPAFALRFWLEAGTLKQERFPMAAILNVIPETSSTKSKLPPETIEALTQMGLLEQVLALLEADEETATAHDEPKSEVKPSGYVKPTVHTPNPEPAPPQKAKSKWNMFD